MSWLYQRRRCLSYPNASGSPGQCAAKRAMHQMSGLFPRAQRLFFCQTSWHHWPPCRPGATMTRIARAFVLFCVVGIMPVIASSAARAEFCSNSTECSAQMVCTEAFLFVKQCETRACNFNSDCPRARRTCFGGICQAGCFTNAGCPAGTRCVGRGEVILGTCTASGGSSGGSPGAPLAGVGQACGRQEFAPGVFKSVPCRSGLTCTFGRCQRPAT